MVDMYVYICESEDGAVRCSVAFREPLAGHDLSDLRSALRDVCGKLAGSEFTTTALAQMALTRFRALGGPAGTVVAIGADRVEF